MAGAGKAGEGGVGAALAAGGVGETSDGDGVGEACKLSCTLNLASCVKDRKKENSVGHTGRDFTSRVLMRPPTVLQLPLEGWQCEWWKDG